MQTLEPTTIDAGLRAQFDAFPDEHRAALAGCLDGLSEEEARAALVPSRTTLLGLVKHAAFVERVWMDESFIPGPGDTIASVRADDLAACRDSRLAARLHPPG